jgi:hypothetical protein
MNDLHHAEVCVPGQDNLPTEVSGSLSPDEQERLARLEQTIHDHITHFRQVGEALLTIRESRLYRATDSSFESYLRRRWDLGASHAYRLMQAAEIVASLETAPPIGGAGDATEPTLPTSEGQVRELGKVRPDLRPAVWHQAHSTAPRDKAGNRRPTARHVRHAAGSVTSSPSGTGDPQNCVGEPAQGQGAEQADPRPWAEFEAAMQDVLKDLRAVKRKLASLVEYDFSTKRMRCRWAQGYYTHATIDAIDLLEFTLKTGLPAELSDDPRGYLTVEQVKQRRARAQRLSGS